VPPTSQGNYANGQVAVVGADGSGRRNIAKGVQASWSHDGSAIHVMTEDASCVPHLADYPAGGGPAQASPAKLKAGDYYFTWSPDDSQIVFTRLTHGMTAANCKGSNTDTMSLQQNLMVMNSDGTGLRTLAANQPSVGRITWTPDGKTLVWARWGAEDAWGPLARVNVSSGTITNFTSSKLQFGTVSISAVGSKIAYSVGDPNSQDQYTHVYISNLDGSGKVSLGFTGTNDGDPVWSPDGSSLVFDRTSIDTGDEQLVVIRPPHTTASVVYTPVLPVDSPWPSIAWSPDSKKIACLGATTPDTGVSTGIVVVGANGTQPKTFAGTAGATNVSWQP